MYLSLSGRKSSGGAWIGIVPSGLSTYGADNWGKKRVKLTDKEGKKRKKKKDPFIRERESPSMATSPPSSSPSASFSSPSLYPSSHSSCHSPPLLSSKSFLLLVSPLQSIRSSSPPSNLPANHATLPSPLFSGRSHPVPPPNLNFLIGSSTFLLLFRPFCLVRVLLCCCGFSCWH